MKYKICPHCGKHNSPTAFDCESCFADLTVVKVTDEETEKAELQNAVPLPKAVRLCEACGFENPANLRKCQKCGEDISDVMPTEANAASQLHFQLSSLDGQYAYELQPGKTVVGREEQLSDYLKEKCYVSRRHAEFTLEGGKLSVVNLSRSNFTYINNVRSVAESVELHDGDEIGLGGNCRNGKRQEEAAYFIVRICSCS